MLFAPKNPRPFRRRIPLAMPAQYLSDASSYAPIAHRQPNNVAQLWIPSKTTSDQHLYIYSQVNATTDTIITGIVSYPY